MQSSGLQRKLVPAPSSSTVKNSNSLLKRAYWFQKTDPSKRLSVRFYHVLFNSLRLLSRLSRSLSLLSLSIPVKLGRNIPQSSHFSIKHHLSVITSLNFFSHSLILIHSNPPLWSFTLHYGARNPRQLVSSSRYPKGAQDMEELRIYRLGSKEHIQRRLWGLFRGWSNLKVKTHSCSIEL